MMSFPNFGVDRQQPRLVGPGEEIKLGIAILTARSGKVLSKLALLSKTGSSVQGSQPPARPGLLDSV